MTCAWFRQPFGSGRACYFLYGSPPRSALGEYCRGGWGALKAKPLFGRLLKLDGKKLHCVYNTVNSEEPVITEVRVCAVDPLYGDQAPLCELTTLGLRGCLLRHRDPAPVGVSHTVRVESSLLHCSGIDELSNDGTFRFRPTSCGQRQKHSNDPPPPRMCQFFFRYVLRGFVRAKVSRGRPVQLPIIVLGTKSLFSRGHGWHRQPH